ncbi:MAG: Rieske 2Fe-2S domain-containing protein [Novosphingobium sp.]|nr:Rieske 2Fe-2S domain-containing protein [Novosphingobium sp.]
MNVSDFYQLRAEPVSKRLARGWHCLGPVRNFDDGEPHLVEAFNTKLVVFRGESGEIAALDNFCPHLGASLAEGRVRGDSVACPFHDWRWGPDGRCTAIPYAKRIPPRAKTRSWTLTVVDQVLYIWHDPEGNPPSPELALPGIEGFETDFTGWDHSVHRIKTNTRELVDNMVDVAHFFYVHGEGVSAGAQYFANVFEGHTAWQFMEMGEQEMSGYDKLKPGFPLEKIDGSRSESAYFGPAYLKSRVISNWGGLLSERYIILGQLPVNENEFDLHMLITVHKTPGLSEAEQKARADQEAQWMRDGTLQDVHIWKTKTRIDNPLLCDGDGPIYQLRRWYEQFFVDAADIKPEMVERFECVTDTGYAMKVWEGQAAERIAELEAIGAVVPGAHRR